MKSMGTKAQIYALVDPRTDKYFYVGATLNLKTRFQSHLKRSTNSKVKAVVDELRLASLEPKCVVLDTVPFQEKLQRERYWLVKCGNEGHPLVNIVGIDTYQQKPRFFLTVKPNQNAKIMVSAAVMGETKDFIDKVASENLAKTSDVVRHLIELGIKHFNE